jgi:hypothetical protein
VGRLSYFVNSKKVVNSEFNHSLQIRSHRSVFFIRNHSIKVSFDNVHFKHQAFSCMKHSSAGKLAIARIVVQCSPPPTVPQHFATLGTRSLFSLKTSAPRLHINIQQSFGPLNFFEFCLSWPHCFLPGSNNKTNIHCSLKRE